MNEPSPAPSTTAPDVALTSPDRGQVAACQGIEPGPSFIRRLNRREYANTVRDLLGVTTDPTSDFPIEERRLNFDNNAVALGISPVLIEQYVLTAEGLAAQAVATGMSRLLGSCDPARQGEDACAQAFIGAFGQRAYRRPVPPEDAQVLGDAYAAGKKLGGFTTGIEVTLAAMLQSPRFLYRVEMSGGAAPAKVEPWELASRLSYLLWNSMPDDALFAAAAAGHLATNQDISAQVTRMMADPRARAMTSAFYDQLLALYAIDDVEKDSKTYPAWNRTLAASMQAESRRFIESALWDGDGTLSSLLTAPYTFVDSTLAKLYGVAKPASGMQKVMLDGASRGGLLTQGGLMAMLANPNQTSPVRRGKFVRTLLMCQELPPPPGDKVIVLPKPDPNLTTRERFARHSTDPSCAGCHRLMDPVGLGFEGLDGIGAARPTENGKTVDVSGEILSFDGGDGHFMGPVDLGRRLVTSDGVKQCVVSNWFRFGMGRAELDKVDDCSLQLLRRRLDQSGGRIRDVVVALTETDAFLYRKGGAP